MPPLGAGPVRNRLFGAGSTAMAPGLRRVNGDGAGAASMAPGLTTQS